MRIASAGNTVVPAYLALLAKGYLVSRDPLAPGSAEETWRAQGDGLEFLAEDPVTLLGLVAMFETRGTDWKASDLDIDHFLRAFPAGP